MRKASRTYALEMDPSGTCILHCTTLSCQPEPLCMYLPARCTSKTFIACNTPSSTTWYLALQVHPLHRHGTCLLYLLMRWKRLTVSTIWKAPCLLFRMGFCPVMKRAGKAPRCEYAAAAFHTGITC